MNSKIPLYFVPGLAANHKIFENLKFDLDRFEVHYLNWIIPFSEKESIESYAKRMCDFIEHKDPVLIGVSFGGVLVQEMSKLINVRRTIIISSILNRNELPNRLKFLRKSKLYKLLPTKVITNIEHFKFLAFGDFAKKRVDLYKKFLSVRDKTYLKWAVHNVLTWKQDVTIDQVIRIHGDSDKIFPIKNLVKYIVIPGGTHIMILNKSKKISKLIEESI